MHASTWNARKNEARVARQKLQNFHEAARKLDQIIGSRRHFKIQIFLNLQQNRTFLKNNPLNNNTKFPPINIAYRQNYKSTLI